MGAAFEVKNKKGIVGTIGGVQLGGNTADGGDVAAARAAIFEASRSASNNRGVPKKG